MIFILGLTLGVNGASAQVRDADLVLNINPEFPTPNQNVTATLTSYVIDIDKAFITWSVNNEKLSAGVGKNLFTFSMNNGESQIELTATINTVEGQSIIKSRTISSANIDMLWQAVNAYTPPFYKGKALVPSEGTFKVVAIPNISTQNTYSNLNNYSFSWEKDGALQPSFSGWGRNSFTFKNSYLDAINKVTVNVADVTGKMSTKNKITLNTSKPKIIFYEKNPLFGVRTEESLTNGLTVGKNGITIVAVPYFIAPDNLNSKELQYKWYVADSEIATPNPKNEISVKPDSNSSGATNIKLSIENIRALFLNTEKQINVNY